MCLTLGTGINVTGIMLFCSCSDIHLTSDKFVYPWLKKNQEIVCVCVCTHAQREGWLFFQPIHSTPEKMQYLIFSIWLCACVLSHFSHVWFFVTQRFKEHCPPGSSVHGILQARILEWVAMPSSRRSSWPRDWTCVSRVSCIGRRVLYHQCHLETPNYYI